MSLKELTADSHAAAENTKFMKAVFAKTLPHDTWADWTLQKSLFYGAIEGAAGANRLLGDLPDLRRAFYLNMDYNEMIEGKLRHAYRPVVVEYYNYILSISNEPNKIMAHLYTWHMGDMFGGQMIKQLAPGPHRNLEFEDAHTLITNIRAKLDDSMGDEANVAFDWAIRMMRDYDRYLG